MEADLRRFYGVRLRDLYTGDLTVRELINLVKYLPRDSALGREMWGEEKATFDQHANLLMTVANILIAAHNEKPKFLSPPK